MATPGPWRKSTLWRRNDGSIAVMSERGPVAYVNILAPHARAKAHLSTDEESDANGRLIAAAPDLLEALKDMLAQSGDPNATTGEFDTAAGRAFRIVQQAEGGQ